MPHLRLTEAARRGDPHAIARLIAAAMPEGTRSTATLQNQCLHVSLRAVDRLNRTQTLSRIRHVLQTLGLQLRNIQIDAYVQQETSPIWSEVITRTGPIEQSLPRQPKSKWQIPNWLADKPNLQTYRQVLVANFDITRLALVIPFVLYGLFFAKYYNVADFLTGNIRIIQFLHGVNLIFHEAGHVLFIFFGQFMTILGGSLNQILIPAVISGYFFCKRQPYSGAITLFWVGENFWDVSIYAKDGRATVLPLLGGDGTIHDWHWLLNYLGWIPYTEMVGNSIYTIGTVIYIIAIALALYYSRKQPSNRAN